MRRNAFDLLHIMRRIPNTYSINTNQNKPRIEQIDSKIKVLYTNADQLPNKMHELLINIGIVRPEVIMLTEVLPKNSETKMTKASIQIKGFQLFTDIENEENIRGLA